MFRFGIYLGEAIFRDLDLPWYFSGTTLSLHSNLGIQGPSRKKQPANQVLQKPTSAAPNDARSRALRHLQKRLRGSAPCQWAPSDAGREQVHDPQEQLRGGAPCQWAPSDAG
eukprot:6488564-Amphidinium_carterae.1